jgi:hypothetical protein
VTAIESFIVSFEKSSQLFVLYLQHFKIDFRKKVGGGQNTMGVQAIEVQMTTGMTENQLGMKNCKEPT